MSTIDAITHHITTRLSRLQKQHNFNPKNGARQIANVKDRTVISAYAAFRELLVFVRRMGLDVSVPYDPCGLDPEGHAEKRAARPRFVYFARTLTTREWKVGVSHDPHKRCAQLQTGNGNQLEVLYKVEGDRRLETLVLRHLEKYKSRGRGGREWLVDLPDAAARNLIGRIRAEGRVFLEGPRLERPAQEAIT